MESAIEIVEEHAELIESLREITETQTLLSMERENMEESVTVLSERLLPFLKEGFPSSVAMEKEENAWPLDKHQGFLLNSQGEILLRREAASLPLSIGVTAFFLIISFDLLFNAFSTTGTLSILLAILSLPVGVFGISGFVYCILGMAAPQEAKIHYLIPTTRIIPLKEASDRESLYEPVGRSLKEALYEAKHEVSAKKSSLKKELEDAKGFRQSLKGGV